MQELEKGDNEDIDIDKIELIADSKEGNMFKPDSTR